MADCKDCEAKNIEHVEDHPDQCCACFDISCGHPPGDLLREQRKHYEEQIARLRAEVELQVRQMGEFAERSEDDMNTLRAEVERLERDKGILIGQSVEAGKLFNEMTAEVEALRTVRGAAELIDADLNDAAIPEISHRRALRAALDAAKEKP